MNICHLPNHIFFIIRDFVFCADRNPIHIQTIDELYGLHPDAYATRPAIKNASPVSWRNFLNTNKQQFVEIKRLTGYYDLKEIACHSMIGLPMYTSMGAGFSLFPKTPTICKLEDIEKLQLANPNRQVDFSLSVDGRSPLPIFYIASTPASVQQAIAQMGGIFSLQTPMVEPPTTELVIPFPFERLTLTLHNIGEGAGGIFGLPPMNLNNNFGISLKAFPFVKHLTVRCKLGLNITTYNNVLRIEVDPAMRLESFVSNMKCEFIDLTNDKTFEKLALVRFSLVTAFPDVSLFRSVRHVDLSGSLAVKDVSSLSHVHTLNISRCKEVEDVSMLGEVYSLNLDQCIRIMSVSGLRKVKYLSMKCLTDLRDGLPLENELRHLITDAATFALAGGQEVCNENMMLTILSVDKRTGASTFNQPKASTPYSALPCQRLSLSDYDLTVPNCDLSRVQTLTLVWCKLPTQFSPVALPQLRQLSLLRCEEVAIIRCDLMPKLKVLKIDGCPLLKSLDIDKDKEMDLLEILPVATIEFLTIRGIVRQLKITNATSLQVLDVIGGCILDSEFTGTRKCRILYNDEC